MNIYETRSDGTNVKAEVVFKNKFSLGDDFVVDASRRDVLQACFSGKLTRKILDCNVVRTENCIFCRAKGCAHPQGEMK